MSTHYQFPYTGDNYSYFGTRVAPPSPFQLKSFEWTPQIAEEMMLAGVPGFEELGKTIRGEYLNKENPAFQDLIKSIYNSASPFITSEQQRINSAATLAGQGGGLSSPAMGQSRQLSEDVLNKLNEQVSSGLFQQFGQERGLQDAAMRIALGLPAQGLQTLYGAGGLERGMGQEALDAQYQDFLRMQGLLNPDFASLLGLTSPSTPTQYGPSGFESLLSGVSPFLLAPATGGGSLFSKIIGK